MTHYRINSSGFTLIEVLIAFLILSIGLLGMAGLQATSLRYGQDAYSRSSATVLAYDIIERIHANDKIATQYIGTATCSDVSTCCDNSLATPANDLTCWAANLQKTLPSGSGEISAVATTNRLKVLIKWTDRERTTTTTPIYFEQSWEFTP